jgi:hypothetical protein
MGAAVWCLMELIRPYFSHVLIPVIICVAAGMAIYVAALLAISSEARRLVRSQFKSFRSRWLKA